MTSKSGGTTFSVNSNGNNQLIGFCYDQNGNQLTQNASNNCGSPDYTYDASNRMVSAKVTGGNEYYFYDDSNKRIAKMNSSGGMTVYIYGASGEKPSDMPHQFGLDTVKRRHLTGITAMVLLATSLVQGSRIKDELQELQGRDLGIAHFIDGKFLVIGLDGRTRQFDLRPNRFCLTSQFSMDGKSLVCDFEGRVAVLGAHFEKVWESRHPARNISAMALSPDGDKVVLAAWDQPAGAARRAQIIVVDRSGSEEVLLTFSSVAHAVKVGGLSWDASGRQITFSADAEIQVYDVVAHSGKIVAQGYDPSWSPDGRWIGYRSAGGRFMLIEMRTGESKPGGPKAQISSTVHWSPDSKYIFVAEIEEQQHPHRTCFENSFIAIYRLSDNARKFVYDPCGLRTETFGWILGASHWIQGAKTLERGRMSKTLVKP